MSEIFAGAARYQSIRLREDEFEGVIDQYSETLFPGYHETEWKPLLRSRDQHCRPDRLLIGRDYRDWWVVEVELSSHPDSHFEQQFENLSEALYGPHLADAILELIPGLDAIRLERLLRQKPGLLCVVDDLKDGLQRICRGLGFEYYVARPYRSSTHGFCLEVTRRPNHFRGEKRAAVTYTLERAGRSLGGEVPAYLPTQFPNINGEGLTVRFDTQVRNCRVTTMAARRVLWIESSSVTPGRPISLRPIDPVEEFYEFVNT